MSIFRIVLTGGAHSGKTKTFNAIRNYYSTIENVHFIGVPETAKELLENGITPKKLESIFEFQDIVFQRQSVKEKTADDMALGIHGDKDIIIVYDRGLLDNKAYLDTQEEFDMILKKYGAHELDILDKYDMVIDLITTVGTDIEFDSDSNPIRLEKEDEMLDLDFNTTKAWLGHRNLKIVRPSPEIEDKFKTVISLIEDLRLAKQKIYLESSYTDFNHWDLDLYNDNNSKLINIEEYILDLGHSNGYEYSIIQRNYKDFTTYLLEVSKTDVNLKKISKLKRIDRDTAFHFINEVGATGINIRKRLAYIENGDISYIDIYDNTAVIMGKSHNRMQNNGFVKIKRMC